MRPSLRVARAVVSLSGAAALLAYAFAGTSVAEDQTVQANGQNQFAPADVTVNVGDTVTWRYTGGFGHTVTATSANWNKDTALGLPSGTVQTSQLFDRPGVYTYKCKTHETEGMKGTVTVNGTVSSPHPTTPRPTTPRPTATRTPTRPPVTATPSGSATPTPSASVATPPVVPTGTVPPGSPTPSAPPPVLATPTASGTPYLGVGGLTAPAPTNRAKGLPVMLALLLVGGIGSAEVRALLANAPE